MTKPKDNLFPICDDCIPKVERDYIEKQKVLDCLNSFENSLGILLKHNIIKEIDYNKIIQWKNDFCLDKFIVERDYITRKQYNTDTIKCFNNGLNLGKEQEKQKVLDILDYYKDYVGHNYKLVERIKKELNLK